MWDENTVKEFTTRLRKALPETPMPTSEFDQGYNKAMMLVSENADLILTEMIAENAKEANDAENV